MNPKPFSALNHLTLPSAMMLNPFARRAGKTKRRDSR
jgi:hypothetical protein